MTIHRTRVLLSHIAKKIFANNLLAEGKVRTILWGPARGLKYRIFPEYGLAPLYGGWEREAQELMTQYIKPGAIVYDIGANYGIHTLLMARLSKEHGHVYAFEPVSSIAAELGENIRLNSLKNTTVVDAAVSDVSGTSSFVQGHHDGSGHLTLLDNEANVIYVNVITLDEFVFDRQHPAPDFIKVDVEGFESNVLRGGKKALIQARPVILIDLHNPEQDIAVGRIFSELGYTAVRTSTMQRVNDLTKGWPDPNGIWGQIIALPQVSGTVGRGM